MVLGICSKGGQRISVRAWVERRVVAGIQVVWVGMPFAGDVLLRKG